MLSTEAGSTQISSKAKAVAESEMNRAGVYLKTMIEQEKVDLRPLVSREVSLSGASEELRMMLDVAPPGTAVITDFAK